MIPEPLDIKLNVYIYKLKSVEKADDDDGFGAVVRKRENDLGRNG